DPVNVRPLGNGAGRLDNGGPDALRGRQVVMIRGLAVKKEEPAVFYTALCDRFGVLHRLLGYRPLPRSWGGGDLQGPRFRQSALRQVGEHGPVCFLQTGDGEAVRFIEDL